MPSRKPPVLDGGADDESGTLRDQAYLPRIGKFLKELIWMARTLRHGRDHVALE